MIVISTKRFVLQWLCNDLLNVFIFRWANCKRHMSKPLTNSFCFIKVLASNCWKSLTFVGINSRQILKQKIVTFFVINSLHLYLSKYKEIPGTLIKTRNYQITQVFFLDLCLEKIVCNYKEVWFSRGLVQKKI